MSDLVEFLRARLDEDERAHGRVQFVSRRSDPWQMVEVPIRENPLAWALPPSRVLAEVKAKRRIIDLHPIYRGPRIQGVDSRWCDFGCELCHSTSRTDSDSIIEAIGYCETILALAQPYADHPDFDPGWKL